MVDLVVTCPKDLWDDWLAEGALPGEPCPPDAEYHWFGRGKLFPDIQPGDRLYVVAHGRVRGYAPVVRIDSIYTLYPLPAWWWEGALWGIVRRGEAVATTIPDDVPGFQGWRRRWWYRSAEVPFPDWRTAGVSMSARMRSKA
jgi:hypothetical protein